MSKSAILFLALCGALSCAPAAKAPERSAPPPDISLAGLAQPDVRLADFKGRVVLLDFWATWCPPCREALPFYSELEHELAPQGLAVLALNVGEDRSTVADFMTSERLSLSVFLDPRAKVPPKFSVDEMPTLFLIDRAGNIRLRHVGFSRADRERLRDAVLGLLSEK